MKSSIRIIKRNQNEDSIKSITPEVEKSVELNTKEMVITVKSWIVEVQQRKRDQARSFSGLPGAVVAVSQNS